MTQQGTRNVKETLPYLGNAAQKKSRKRKGNKERENPNTYFREEAYREGEKEKTIQEGLDPLIY